MTHGYMLSGSGSNVYVQNLCRALVRAGHDVHLIIQEPDPLAYDFVNEHLAVDGDGISLLGSRETPYPGRCAVYRPEIGDLLPVYVYDDYPGWRVKTFLDLTEEELENYIRRNTTALRAALDASGTEAVVTNHSVPGPLIARRALESGGDFVGIPYTSIVHGSCLQYISRRSKGYMALTREGLEGARNILALSSHSAGTIAEDFPDMRDKTLVLPGGVDTQLFHPGALDLERLRMLDGGSGRGPEQEAMLEDLLDDPPTSATDLAERLRSISASYEPRAHDRDAGERITRLLEGDRPLIVYVGKLIHSKGVHSLLSAFARLHTETGARLLVVGFGTFREFLQTFTLALSVSNSRIVELLAGSGTLFEGGPPSLLGHFDPTQGLLRYAAGMAESIEFVGPLRHETLAELLTAADAGVVPSIFPETFGLVAAELAASGVPPFVADHSGLREAGGIVGQNLTFDLRVSMSGFEANLVRALADYLELPSEERLEARETVRRNSVDVLGWDTLAERLVAIAGG